jgi:hypothetical protein
MPGSRGESWEVSLEMRKASEADGWCEELVR